jgi:hypothetical protein
VDFTSAAKLRGIELVADFGRGFPMSSLTAELIVEWHARLASGYFQPLRSRSDVMCAT